MKRLRSIVVGMLLVLAVAVPVLAVDGVTKLLGVGHNITWGTPDIYSDKALLDGDNGLTIYDISKNNFTTVDSGYSSRYAKSIYANKVVYTKNGISMVDINTLERRQISTIGNSPAIYGDKIVYYKDYNVYLYNLLDGTEIKLSADGTVPHYSPYYKWVDIYGNYVVWRVTSPDSGLVLYNLATGQSRTLNIVPQDISSSPYKIEIDEDYVLWNYNKEVYLYKLNHADPNLESYLMISDPSSSDQVWLASINNGKVVWDSGYSWVNIYDIKTGIRSKVSSSLGAYGFYNPITDGDKIVVYDYGYGQTLIDITSPSEEIYSLNATANSATVINPYKTDDPTTIGIDERVVATIATGAGPSDSALSPDETKLYILNSTAKTVTIAQTYDFVPVNTVNINPTNKQTATAVAGDNDSNTYVALKSSTGAGVVKKITSAGIETTLTVGVNPNGLKISPDNKKLLVSNSSSSNVTAIDLATFTIIEGNITTGAGPKLVKP